jgi:hypothetical protein
MRWSARLPDVLVNCAVFPFRYAGETVMASYALQIIDLFSYWKFTLTGLLTGHSPVYKAADTIFH